MSETDPVLDALQTTLAAEHAAVFRYGLLGGRTSASTAPELLAAISAAYAAHRGRRDQLTSMVLDAEGEPVAAAAAYEPPDGLGSTAGITSAALETERTCATTYAWLVANTAGETRRWAITALNETAVRELAFRGTPEMFPGAGEHADR